MKPAQKGHPWGVKHKLVVVFGRRIELDKIRSLFGRSWNGFETTASAGRPHVHPSLPNRGRASRSLDDAFGLSSFTRYLSYYQVSAHSNGENEEVRGYPCIYPLSAPLRPPDRRI